MGWWLEPRHSRSRGAAVALAATAWLWPVTFYLGYFAFIQQTGGQSHRTFRTASVEPKQQAYELIRAESGPAEPITVVCQDWWCYWPIAYLATGDANVRVMTRQEWNERAEAGQSFWKDPAWFVEFAGTPEERATERQLKSAHATAAIHTIRDYAGRPLLSLFAPPENSSRNY